MVQSRYVGDGHPTFNRNPYNVYVNPYYWVDHNGSLDPGTYDIGQKARLVASTTVPQPSLKKHKRAWDADPDCSSPPNHEAFETVENAVDASEI